VNEANQLIKVGVRIDQNRLVTTMEQGTRRIVLLVEIPGITKREVLHDLGQGGISHLDGKLHMIFHPAKAVILGFLAIVIFRGLRGANARPH